MKKFIKALALASAVTMITPTLAFAENSIGAESSVAPSSGYWLQRPDGNWTFTFFSGKMATSSWLCLNWDDVNNWYYFDQNSNMASGWVTLGEDTFYLHPSSDGDRGQMYTGWHEIDGKWYYFSDISDGRRGHLLKNTTTPDGYQVGEDGAYIR